MANNKKMKYLKSPCLFHGSATFVLVIVHLIQSGSRFFFTFTGNLEHQIILHFSWTCDLNPGSASLFVNKRAIDGIPHILSHVFNGLFLHPTNEALEKKVETHFS